MYKRQVKGSPNNAYDIVVEVMDAGECNEGSFRYSLDGGNTFTEEMTIPITGEAELATTGLTAKFTDAEGGDSFMEGDRFTFSTTSPAMSNESVISAVESLINSPLMFEFVHIVGVSSKALWASLCTIANDFLTKYKRPLFFVCEARGKKADESLEDYVNAMLEERKGINNIYMQVVCSNSRYQRMDGRVQDINNAGIVTGLYGRAKESQSIGEVKSFPISEAKLLKLLPEGIEDYIETLDKAKYVTIRQYIGKEDYYVTSANMMSPEGSDYSYAEDVRVSNRLVKAADYSKQQKEAKAARGYVSIYRSEYNNALQVTKGHCFKTEPDAGGNELKFYCCENTVIDAGEPVGRVLVEAEATGTYYNIAPGRITISMIHLDGVDYVTNEDDWLFEEGAEEEDLEDLRDRCMSSWAELATRTIEEKLRNAAKAVPGVLDARIDAQHPRGQGTVDVIVTGAAGEASPELIRKVGEAIEPLKGNYEDYLVKSSEVVRQDFELVIYLAEDAATDGVDAQATKLIEDMMALTRGEMNTLYRDSIIQVLSTKIDNYRKTDILQPSDDMVLEQDKVIMAGDINVTVRNVVQSARGKE